MFAYAQRVVRPLFAALLALQLGAAPQIQAQQTRLAEPYFVGATGCKSSSCHGGAGEKRSQYITWTRQDVHTRGYAVLTNARSARIADALQLKPAHEWSPAATTSARCTVCHSPFHAIPPAQRAPTADPTESISCESCHGAAGSWLRGHTRKDWTYATRVGAGMRDLKSFYVRANTCVACHQNIDADIIAAGHPELTFELDRQSTAQPKHWSDPPDSGARAWLVGQAVALREMSWRLSLNSGADPQTRAAWQALDWLLAEVTAAEPTLQRIDSIPFDSADPPFARIQQQADALARTASQQNLDRAFARRLMRSLLQLHWSFTEPGAPSRELLFRRAQRLTLGLERLAGTARPTGDKPRADDQLELLRRELESPMSFDPVQFARRLAAFETNTSP